MFLTPFVWVRGLTARWCHDRHAATAIEYGLIAGGISIAVVAAVFLMGDSLADLFSTAGGAMSDSAARVTEP